MALTFVYFYKKDSTKNISKKAEFLTNQVLNLCSEENVELEKYLTYEEIINDRTISPIVESRSKRAIITFNNN